MALGDIYDTGLVVATYGSPTVEGAGVVWSDVKQGDIFYCEGAIEFVASVDAALDTITLQGDWLGPDASAAPYRIHKVSWQRYSPAEDAKNLASLLTSLAQAGVIFYVTGTEPDPELGDDGQYAIKINTGAWQQWYKTGGVWVLQGTPVGTNYRGAWTTSTAYVANDVVTRDGYGTYICILASVGDPPESSPTYWELMAADGADGGAGGGVALSLTFSTLTADSDPGAGKIRLNQATQNTATILRVDLADSGGADITAILDSLDDGTSTVKGQLRLFKASDPTKYLIFNLTSAASPAGYRNLTATIVGYSAASPFTDGDAVVLAFSAKGDKGDTGATGGAIAIPYVFSTTTTDSDPGAGNLRLDNATQNAAVIMRVDLLDSNALDRTTTFTTLAARTSAIKALFRLFKTSDPTAFIDGHVTAVATPTGYRNLTFVVLSASTTNPFANTDAVTLALDWTGDKGDTGPAPTISGTSTDSVTVDTGTKTFTTQAGIAWSVGQRLVASNAGATRQMFGAVASYIGTTLELTVDDIIGSGTDASWTISISGGRGATGAQGDTGPVGMSWQGAWNISTDYLEGDAVSYDGQVYIALMATTGDAPDANPHDWSLMFDPNAPADQITVQTKAANYTAVAGDRATMLDFTATATLSLTAAATLANGWYCYVKGDGAAITIDADGAETIDGAATKAVPNGSALILICTGTAFITFMTHTDSGLTLITESIKTTAYTILTTDVGKRIVLDSTSAATFTLPPAATAGTGFAFWCRSINTGVLTVDGDGSETIDGDASFVLEEDEDVLLTSTGTGWRKVIHHGEGHQEPETDVASAATADIGATNTEAVRITGTTTITSFGTRTRRRRRLRFTGKLTLTHNATSLILPGAANITTAVNDIAIAESDASGNWRVISYTKAASGPARETLNAARTYYVRTDGSDSNDGLSDSAGGAFLTIQKAINVVYGNLDFNGYNITIQVRSGTYTGAISLSVQQVGAGTVTLTGDTTTPSNVVISTTSVAAISIGGQGRISIQGFKLTTAGSGAPCLYAYDNSIVTISGNMEFGTCVHHHIRIINATVNCLVNYSITGNATFHWSCANGLLAAGGQTITLTGTPAFTAFAYAFTIGIISCASITFSGSATGQRYNSSANSLIQTFGGGASYLPGNSAGATSDGGLYL